MYDYGTSKVVGRDQEHIKLELVDNKVEQCNERYRIRTSSHVRYIKTKRSFDICYTIGKHAQSVAKSTSNRRYKAD